MPPLPTSETLASTTEPAPVSDDALMCAFDKKNDSSCEGPKSDWGLDSMIPAVVSMVTWPTFDRLPMLFVTIYNAALPGISGTVKIRSPGNDRDVVGSNSADKLVLFSGSLIPPLKLNAFVGPIQGSYVENMPRNST